MKTPHGDAWCSSTPYEGTCTPVKQRIEVDFGHVIRRKRKLSKRWRRKRGSKPRMQALWGWGGGQAAVPVNRRSMGFQTMVASSRAQLRGFISQGPAALLKAPQPLLPVYWQQRSTFSSWVRSCQPCFFALPCLHSDLHLRASALRSSPFALGTTFPHPAQPSPCWVLSCGLLSLHMVMADGKWGQKDHWEQCASVNQIWEYGLVSPNQYLYTRWSNWFH